MPIFKNDCLIFLFIKKTNALAKSSTNINSLFGLPLPQITNSFLFSRELTKHKHLHKDFLMRQSNKSRSRNKNNGNRRSMANAVNRVFDSAGPEGKVRGTPQQIIEKYMTFFRDSQLSGDRIAAENFQQHAEHYIRLLSEALREQNEKKEQQELQAASRKSEKPENPPENVTNVKDTNKKLPNEALAEQQVAKEETFAHFKEEV